ncbi:serpin B9-like [Panonychus citri]|uniref:serpin B9-like n=1 Tax=Panonychus citri TaxID=50023 RepID=UPI0023078C48|nr:serpin B9-like [Panonychus citri]XP_053202814.1 serpin B9-like [Panonychus citri]XP_053202815.1 serpin B9-like [Panonychus citri]XP_053202816.1 serpin B9-like [Panonychus citri]
MIWSTFNGHQYILALVLFISCEFTSSHCGYTGRYERRRTSINNDPLTGRSSRSDNSNSNKFSLSPNFATDNNNNNNNKNNDDKDDSQTINRPSSHVITSSRFTESLSLTSASVSLASPSSSSSSSLSSLSSSQLPDAPLSPSPSSSSSDSPLSSSISPENIEPQLPPSPSPPKFPGVSEGIISRDMLNIVTSNNIFGFKLFKALNKFHGNENIFISPLSLFSTLVTVYAGSSSSTEDEMISLLQLKTMTENQIQTAFRDVLHTLLYDIGKKNNLKLLNGIFIDKELNVSSAYVDKVRIYYNACVEKVGFTTEPAYVTSWANDFVSWWTHGLIPSLLDSTLDPLTRLLLINVIYFKGAWAEPFNPTLTSEQNSFHNFDGSTSKVPLMRSTSTINYHCDHNQVKACFIEKLYSTGSLSFLAITPTNGTDLSHIESILGTQTMTEMLGQLQDATVELGLPRFSVSGSYDLLKPLEYLGMKAAFSPKKADLSKMGNSKELFVKEAKHKTVLQVTEEGTLAAGATVAEIGTRKRSPRLIIDRPFIFLIRDLRTEAILFLGRINSLP